MADEIKETYRRTTTNDPYKNTINPTQASITQTAVGVSEQIVSASTVVVEVTFPSLTTYGRGYFTNMDATNPADIYVSDAGSTVIAKFGTLKPSEPNAFRLFPGARYWLIGTAGAVNVHASVLED